ncbi:telomerase-binding EST1A isoform X1 [Brachionus plicatilis]|uniref:Telomerase-binding EST1A isoform X1 n=1 Tax=Brachionus plicatilis TaxID=10195 RepID=A0A3M7Q9H9_BRAPC|nr:telomerase-binding EST1A isoform X1 [Brachionus plicatilis]
MSVEKEKFDKKKSNQEMTGNNGKKKNRHPELARYQPPSSRNANNQNQTLQNTNKDLQNVKLSQEKHPEVIKPAEKSSNNPSGGLIKLDQKAIDKIINKGDQRISNDRCEAFNSDENTDSERHLIIKSDRLQKNESRTLFNPNNPDKPIHVDLKSRQGPSLKPELKKPNIIDKKNLVDNSKKKEPEIKIDPRNEELINRVSNLIKHIQPLEEKLKNMLASFQFNQFFDQFLENINQIREHLNKACTEALFAHLEMATNSNTDLNHWRCCYHLLIEALRKELNSNKSLKPPQQNYLSKCIKDYIDQGIAFYSNLMSNLEKKYFNFESSLFVDLNYYDRTLKFIDKTKNSNTQIRSKDAKYCLMAFNRIYIYLGDLERYREMIFPSQPNQRDYSLARHYYLKAIPFAPKVSRAYHQLAILAVYTKRRLDSCYYYFRCLQVPIPLTSVRQSLNSIFEEVRQKSDIIQKSINQAKLNKEKNKKNTQHKFKNRVEIWYKPSQLSKTAFQSNSSDSEQSNSESDNEIDGKYEPEEKDLSISEVNKRFMLNYLNLIGKLFTKVGMETYDEICSNMLHQFSELLKRSSSSLGKNRLLQITVINISLIEIIHRTIHSDISQARTQLSECALQLSLDMFGLIVNRFNYLIKKHPHSSLDTWNQLFPSIKVFLDWMLCSIQIWHPFPDQLRPDLGPNFNRWSILVDFFNIANKNVNLFENEKIDHDLYKIKLEEDLELAGFVPLLSLPREDYDFQNNANVNIEYVKNFLTQELVEKEKVKKRMRKCLIFAEYLCGLEKPIMKFDVVNNCYSLIEIKAEPRLETKRTISTCSSSSFKSNTNADEMAELNDTGTEISGDELNSLREKHRFLKSKVQEQQKQEKQIQSLVEANLQRQIELEIRPKFIVADTNCYIDYLNLIDLILKSNYYILILPLLVLSELEKLAKSISNLFDDSQEHAEYLQKNAKRAIEFLNSKFEKRERNIKAMTSQGSILETIQFRTEEVVKPGTNDELILGCCLHYCRDNARDYMPANKNDAIHLFRDVVLLTEDRHLRMKAHTRNVPVKNIKQFCKWSGLLVSSNVLSSRK